MIPNMARRAPHQVAPPTQFHHAPNAALLIDFDNVTMGIRSDLGKELKALLNSEVIRGKVAVQRAYADWRRYPQYIVPLAESSIDLIFAPAYGSSKKNATDLRMAIDAIELVFTRPEIGTYILMTGDSDFSSCVLKLKEYGKYVIGVGMRESSSDLLIQNCDEYYSYHALSGLTRTDEGTDSAEDPWVLLKRAAQQMVSAGDVMRTDRLKQVMLELDPSFDEKKIGYSKFSRFVQEGASKGIIRLRKMENGQHEIELDGGSVGEVAPATARAAAPRPEAGGNGRRGRGRGRDRDEPRRERPEAPPVIPPALSETPVEEAASVAEAEPVSAGGEARDREPPAPAPAPSAAEVASEAASSAAAAGDAARPGSELQSAYGLLQQAVRQLGGTDGRTIRDGDVKRKMLDISPDFDETKLGFPKFTRFLRQAHDSEAIDLQRAAGGNYEVSIAGGGRRYAPPQESRRTPAEAPAARPPAPSARPRAEAPAREPGAAAPSARPPEVPATPAPATRTATPAQGGVGIRGRRGGRGGALEGPPPLLPGQVIQAPRTAAEEPRSARADAAPATAAPQETAEAVTEAAAKSRARRGRRGRAPVRTEEVAGAAAPAEAVAPAPATPAHVVGADLPAGAAAAGEAPSEAVSEPGPAVAKKRGRGRGRGTAPGAAPDAAPVAESAAAARPRRGTKAAGEPQAAAASEQSAPAPDAEPKKRTRSRSRANDRARGDSAPQPTFTAEALGLPTGAAAITEYLSSAYKGIGKKTAETLLDAFGSDLFRVMEEEPQRVRDALGDRRADTLLEQWRGDVAARRGADSDAPATAAPEAEGGETASKPRSRRGGRGRGRSREAARSE